MSTLDSIRSGIRYAPPRILLYGIEGIGKSTTAAQAPKPIFIPTEEGLDQIDCASFPLAYNLDDVQNALNTLIQETHDYQTVVIDSLDFLEQIIWDLLCKKYDAASIEKVDGGYGKGYIQALTYWRYLLTSLAVLRNHKNMSVIFLAHAKVEKFEDPEFSAYDRYSPRLNKHATALLSAWSDAVLFATRSIATRTENSGFGRNRTIATNKDKDSRILRCVGSPACMAKNRYMMPAEMPLCWSEISKYINLHEKTGESHNG